MIGQILGRVRTQESFDIGEKKILDGQSGFGTSLLVAACKSPAHVCVVAVGVEVLDIMTILRGFPVPARHP